jgi:hypothetical protein
MFKKSLLIGGLALSTALLMTGCMEEKEIPADKLITIYDSNLQETSKIRSLDTLYAKIAGLAPNEMHKIEIIDPDGKLVTETQIRSNNLGIIEPMALWYDVGLKKDENGKFVISEDALTLKSFYIKVTSLENKGTDFKQDFFLLLTKPKKDEMPKPVVYAASVTDGNISNANIENTFLETGSKNADGTTSPLTKVYVKGEQIPFNDLNGNPNTEVDIYIVPFSDGLLEDGIELTERAVAIRKGVATKNSDDGNYKVFDATLVWDLNKDPKLINPGDSNNAYTVVVDVNRDGKFTLGQDLNNDGVTDKYVDGIDGQGSAGFIVMNTEANNNKFRITDVNGYGLNSIAENVSNQNVDLYFSMKNIPTTETTVSLYVIDKDATELSDGEELTDVRKDGKITATLTAPDNNNTFMPYIQSTKFINTITDDSLGYTVDVEAVKPLDIVVDVNKNDVFDKGVDYYLPNSVNILPVDNTAHTTSDSDGSDETSIFNETNSSSKTDIYLKFGDDKNASASGNEHYAYFFKDSATPNNGDELFGEILRKQICTTDGCVTKYVDLNSEFIITNPTDENNKYVIVVDKNDNHTYDSDTDSLLHITIADTDEGALPDVSYINIASGGVIGNAWQHWVNSPYTSVYDYRDVFTVSADDTVPGEWSRYSWFTKGIKAIWNPYIKNAGWYKRNVNYYINEKGETYNSMLNNGQMIDLYIVNAETYKLKKDGDLNDSVDVRGHKDRMNVQFSCRNGAYLQTVWRAPLTVGKYYLIVDVNMNGKIDDGVDLIDAVTQTGRTIKDDPNVVGFRVIED